jgi:hypothetical protein
MSYLELARNASDARARSKLTNTPEAMGRCEKSERSEISHTAVDLEDERCICRGIERDLGLPLGSLVLWDPLKINS